MNRNTTYALFGVTFALVASGLVGSNLLSAQPSGIVAQDTTPADDGMKITGHVTSIATGADGNIKAYRQSDNIVVNNGKDCVTRLLFGGSSAGRGAGLGTVGAASNCLGTLTNPWTVIAVGNRSSTTAANILGTDHKLVSEVNGTGNANNLARQVGTILYTNSTGTAGTNLQGSSSTVVISTTFGPISGLGTAGTQVTESGLFNSTTQLVTGLFAHQPISSIALNNGDSLTIKWTINIG